MPAETQAPQSFTRDTLPPEDDSRWSLYQKTAPTRMMYVPGPFQVETITGPHFMPIPGWLAVDAVGWPYPIATDEHSLSYKPVIDQGFARDILIKRVMMDLIRKAEVDDSIAEQLATVAVESVLETNVS